MKVIFQAIVVLSLITQVAYAKTSDKFKSYKQITDKEVLLETKNGAKILFTAYDKQTIKITYHNHNDIISLITPDTYFDHSDLMGSIYVEEINDKMQITTTSKNGMYIKIEKKPLRFIVVNKETNQELVLDQKAIANGATLENETVRYVSNAKKTSDSTINPKL